LINLERGFRNYSIFLTQNKTKKQANLSGRKQRQLLQNKLSQRKLIEKEVEVEVEITRITRNIEDLFPRHPNQNRHSRIMLMMILLFPVTVRNKFS